MARDRPEIEKELVRQLGISPEEAETYLDAIIGTKIDRDLPASARRRAVVDSLVGRGMLIKAAKGGAFLPVHPRLALSNLFRMQDEKRPFERKEKRLSVDRLTLELIPIFEKAKDTNPPP